MSSDEPGEEHEYQPPHENIRNWHQAHSFWARNLLLPGSARVTFTRTIMPYIDDNLSSYLSDSDLSDSSFSDSSPSKPAPNIPGLLRLPVELRLQIYKDISSAFALLQLAYTHPRLLAEIRSEPAIYTAAFGYSPPTADTPPHLHPFQLSRIERLLDRAEYYCCIDMDEKYDEGGVHVRKMWCKCCFKRFGCFYMIPASAEGGFFCGGCKQGGCNKPIGSLLGRKHGEVGDWRKEGGHWVYYRDAYEGLGDTSDQ